MSLAAKLPYNHAYAGGFPGLGAQPLPQDADCLDYLGRMAAADGAGVEVSVANAVDAFISGAKDAGVWDSIRASCVLAGARTLAGALVPLKNEGPELWAAPTPTIENSHGSIGTWDADTQTATSSAATISNTFPRFKFPVAIVAGKDYQITATLVVTDADALTHYRLGYDGVYPLPAAVGNVITIDVTRTASTGDAVFELDFDSTIGPASVTIESLSIREVIAAPTNVANGFVEGDYDRQNGLTGDGATTYLDSGRASDDDPQNDRHLSVFATSATTNNRAFIGSIDRNVTPTSTNTLYWRLFPEHFLCNASSELPVNTDVYSGNQAFVGVTRSSAGTQVARLGNNEYVGSQVSVSPSSLSNYVFARNDTDGSLEACDATISFYSIGTSLSLEDLDTSVTDLMHRIRFALLTGENPAGLDPATIDYVLRGYEAGGTLA